MRASAPARQVTFFDAKKVTKDKFVGNKFEQGRVSGTGPKGKIQGCIL